MKRVLEPEYMDTAEEADSYAHMDHGDANASIAELFVSVSDGRGHVLDLGTGPGDIPILIAQRAPDLDVTAIDAAAHMLALAAERVAQAGLTGRIHLQQADAKKLPFADDSFDGVVSNTILHHIPDPVAFLAEAERVRKPDGVLVIRDLFRPDSEDAAWALVDLHAAGATEAQRRLLFDSLHAALTLEEAVAATAAAGIRGATVEMTSDRHYTIQLKGR